MKSITFKRTSRPLEKELGISAFEVAIDGECQSVIIAKNQLDEYLSLHQDGEDGLCVHEENAAAVAGLRTLLPSMADIATHVRDYAKVTDLQGYSLNCWAESADQINCLITTPFGAGPDASSFANVLYRTSDACMSGLPSSVGIGILQQALTKSLRLQDPPTGSGAGSRAGFIP